MNHLLAKISGRNGLVVKILSLRKEIFEIPDLSSSHIFSTSYKLEEGEWYKIVRFISREFENDLVGKEFESTSYNQISREQYSQIKYLCSKQSSLYLFQKMLPTQVLKKKLLYFSDAPTIEENKSIIILSDCVDAIYDTEKDILYFRELSRISSMFKNIESLYREATQREVDTFLGQKFISLKEGYSGENVKKNNRKRIAMAMDAFMRLSSKEKSEIIEYTKSYCHDVQLKRGKFEIGNEEQLKKILYGINERYYTTPVGREKRLANSVMKLE